MRYKRRCCGGVESLTRKFNPAHRKRESVQCIVCDGEFMAVTSEIKRGRGRTCGRRCAAKLASPKDQLGQLNPNWRGGSEPYRDAKRRYRARHMAKARAHMLVRDAIARGALLREPCETCGAQSKRTTMITQSPYGFAGCASPTTRRTT